MAIEVEQKFAIENMDSLRRRLSELGATLYFRKPADLNSFMEIGKLVRDVISGNERGVACPAS